MATYSELIPANYYLIQDSEHASVELVYVPMVTEKAVLLEYQDEDQSLRWVKKTDSVFEIVEKLTEEQAVIYESLFDEDEDEDGDDDGFDWDDEEDDEDEWFDDEDDKKVKALNN